MSIKIKKILEDSVKEGGTFTVVGKELESTDGKKFILIFCNDDDEFPYVVEEIGNNGNLYAFNKQGITMADENFVLTNASLMRLKTAVINSNDKWDEVELNEDFSNLREVLESYGYKEKIFAVITDWVSNISTPPIPALADSHEVKTEWVIRIDSISDEEDEYSLKPCERVVGIMKYINKNTQKIDKRQVFIAFYDEDLQFCSTEQLESIRPATEEEIEIWAEAGKDEYKEYEFLPLLIENSGKFVKDPDLLGLEELLKEEE